MVTVYILKQITEIRFETKKEIRIQGPCSQGRGAILNYEMPSNCIYWQFEHVTKKGSREQCSRFHLEKSNYTNKHKLKPKIPNIL